MRLDPIALIKSVTVECHPTEKSCYAHVAFGHDVGSNQKPADSKLYEFVSKTLSSCWQQVMPDDHSEVVPLLPIPNRTVKRLCADDSAGSRVKVGHRQALTQPPNPLVPQGTWGFGLSGTAFSRVCSVFSQSGVENQIPFGFQAACMFQICQEQPNPFRPFGPIYYWVDA